MGNVGDPWDPNVALASLVTPVHQEDTEEEQARTILRKSVVQAANRIAHIAIYASDDRLAFKAAQYIVDRNLGRIADNVPLGEDDPWRKLQESLDQFGKDNGI